jgi:hypothetical protein
MRHFSAVNVKNLYINRDEFESPVVLASYPGVTAMFAELFEDPNTFAEAVVEGHATLAKRRLVADFFSAFLGTVNEQPSNVLLANSSKDLYFVVHFS